MSKPPVLISFSEMNVKQARLQLTAQLHDKETLLGKIGTSQITRNALIKQTELLRKELLELSQYDEEDKVPEEIESRYLKIQKGSSEKYEYSSLLPPAPSNSTPSKHRAKNVNGTSMRKPDADFATEIGQGLLNEIRKLQITLQEKDNMIRQLELSQSDNEKTTESIQHTLKQRQEVEDKLKEEIWNLEVENQELHANLSESNQLVSKHTLEFTKLTKKLKSQSEQIDIMKAQEEKSNSVIEAIKARHEQEIYNLRRQVAAGQRENTQIKKQVDTLNTELKICKAKLAVKQAASARVTEEIISPEPETTSTAITTDPVIIPYVSPPQVSNRNQAMETETLKQSLAHAHRIISNLRSSLHKEKMEKFEVKKMLTDSQESIEQLRKEVANSSLGSVGKIGKKKVGSKKKRVGVARKAKGLYSDTEKSAVSEQSDLGSESGSESDQDYMDPQFSLDGMTMPFASTTMKSLSSELEENRVQVTDTGVNTESMEQLIEKEKQKALEDMIPKAQVEKMMEELKQISRQQLEKSVVDETALRSSIEMELKQDMIPKTEVNLLLESLTQKSKKEMEKAINDIKQSEDAMKLKIEQELRKDMIPQKDVDTLIKEAVRNAKAQLEDTLRHNIAEELKQSDTLKEATSQQEEELRLNIENELRKNMLPKTQVDLLLEDARQEAREEAKENMIAKDTVETMISAATQPLAQEISQYKQELERMSRKEKDSSIEQHEKSKDALDKALQNQKLELEKAYLENMEQQKLEMQEVKKTELDKFALESEMKKKAEIEEHTQVMKAEFDLQKQELYNSIKNDLEKELGILKNAEIDAFTKRLESQKKEYDELKQQMADMLTKDSVDVLIKRAVTEAVENTEKKHTEILSGMISKDYSDRLVADSVERALEQERNEKAELHMMSKAEAEALAKVAAADAVIKERQAVATREKELITKEEADSMVQAAVKKAIDKHIKMKERISLIPKDNTKEVTKISIPANQPNSDPLETPLPTENTQEQQKDEVAPELPVIERSLSTSKLAPPTINISPSPSMSTPTTSSRKLRLTSSVQSFRLGSKNKKEKLSSKPSTNNITSNTEASFGSIRVLDTSNYGTTHLHLSKKQSSTMSVSTMSSNEDTIGRMPMLMNSIEGLSSFVGSGIEPEVITAITQTMIGEWMSKHTRRYVGGGISEKKHQRFFWVHPYTKTLYWSSVQPGTEGSEGKTKSALIGSVTAVSSGNSSDTSPMSLLIRSPRRSIKVTASSLERHELWIKSLSYLLGKNANSLEEEDSRTIASSFVENAGHSQQKMLKSKLSNATFTSEAQVTQYDSDDSEDVASIRSHIPTVSA